MSDEETARALLEPLLRQPQYSGLSFLVADVAAALAAARAEQAERDARIAETMPVFAGPRDVAAAIRAAAASPNTPPAAE